MQIKDMEIIAMNKIILYYEILSIFYFFQFISTYLLPKEKVYKYLQLIEFLTVR